MVSRALEDVISALDRCMTTSLRILSCKDKSRAPYFGTDNCSPLPTSSPPGLWYLVPSNLSIMQGPAWQASLTISSKASSSSGVHATVNHLGVLYLLCQLVHCLCLSLEKNHYQNKAIPGLFFITSPELIKTASYNKCSVNISEGWRNSQFNQMGITAIKHFHVAGYVCVCVDVYIYMLCKTKLNASLPFWCLVHSLFYGQHLFKLSSL